MTCLPRSSAFRVGRWRAGVEGAVRVVLDEQQALAGRDLEQSLAQGHGHAHARGVREVRHHVTGPGPVPGLPGPAGLLGQVRQVDPVRSAPDRPDREVGQPGRAGQAHVAGRDREQDVALIGPQRPGHGEHRFLVADGDHDRLGIDRDALVGRQVLRDQLVDDPLGPAVLEDHLIQPGLAVPKLAGQVGTERVQVVVDERDVEELLARPPGGERDRVRVPAGDLVQEVHRLQSRVEQRSVQLRGDKLGRLPSASGGHRRRSPLAATSPPGRDAGQ